MHKRAIIESIIAQLKNISQIVHVRHRSPANFVVYVRAGLIAYSQKEKNHVFISINISFWLLDQRGLSRVRNIMCCERTTPDEVSPWPQNKPLANLLFMLGRTIKLRLIRVRY